MKFDFDTLIERRGTNSYKWDSDPNADVLPMWVADMDFKTAPCIIEALERRVAQGIFGYVKVPESYYSSILDWFYRRHNWKINNERIIYTIGVVPAISAVIKALSKPGDGVILQTPAYNCFFSSVRNNKCQVIENPLIPVPSSDESGKGRFSYQIDYKNLEALAEEPNTTLLILCNPHNPTGRVWTRDELERIKEICHKNGVIVISDEIHCELTHPGYDYIPYATIDNRAIICCSPSKAFNTAGLQIANIICPDIETQNKIDRAINDNEVCDVNPFGVVGLQAAYDEGEEWLKELNEYLYSNFKFLVDTLETRMPNLKICSSESTYLAWIDIRPLGISSGEVEEYARKKGKVWINSGGLYGGEGYIRINYACPRRRLAEGLDRFCKSFGR